MIILAGCVTKRIDVTTTNHDQNGTKLSERREQVKVRGFLASSKTVGLQGSMTSTNAWSTNTVTKSGPVLTNVFGTSIVLEIDSAESDVSTNAAGVIAAPAKPIEALGKAAKDVKALPGT